MQSILILGMSAPKEIIRKIEAFTRKFYLNRLIQGVLVGAVLWIVFYLAINGLEYFSWSPPKGRFVLFLFLLIGSAFTAVFYFFIPLVNLIRFRNKMSIEQASILIGRFFPEINDKLLNTIQLSNKKETDADNALLVAAIEQRSARLSPIRFSDAVNLKGNLKWLGVFFGLLLVLILLMVFLPSFAVQPTQRIINFEQEYEKPLPYQVEIEHDEMETTQGRDVTFHIKVNGERVPDAFYVKSELGQQLMTRSAVNEFNYTFKNLFNDLKFNVIGGEYTSRPIHIKVRPNPTLLSYRCELHFPSYIHRSNESLEAKTRLIVPQGTQLSFSFATRDTDRMNIIRDSLAIGLTAQNGVFEYQFIASQPTKFEAQVQNQWNQSVESLPFSIDVLPDAYPDIRVESFDEQLSPDVYFSGLVTDDYGFSLLTFHCKVREPIEKSIVKKVPLDLKQTRTSFFYRFHMDSLGILPGQNMEVYFEIWDNDGFHGPKSKRSEAFVYYKPSETTLDSIADSTSENIMNRLEQKSQEANNLHDEIEKMLQELIQKKNLDWSDKEKMKKLMERQQQIQDEWNKLQEEQEKLSDFIKEHGLGNEDLIKKQERINKLFNEVVPEEMREIMEQIDKLLEEMPREQMQQMMQDIKKNNQSMQDLLDRNLSLLEQLKMEKDLSDLANKLEKLGEELQKQNSENQNKAEENKNQKSTEEAKEAFDKMMDELDKLLEKNETFSNPLNMQKDEEMQESISQDLLEAIENEQKGEQQQSSKHKNNAGQKMQQMANNMMQQMQMLDMQQLAEDAHLLRILLENVVHASHEQESLMKTIETLRSDDPSLVDKIVRQKEIADNFKIVHDSLHNMALRQPTIKNFVFEELHTIDNQSRNALKHLNDLKLSQAVRHQQTAIMAMNNLALMLAESLENMENDMEAMGMPMNSPSPKSGKKSQPNMQQMQQMQQELSQQLKQLQEQMLKHGQQQNSMSEQFARMAAEQEMLRQGMQKMLNEMKENGQLGDDGLNEIIKDMEKLEEELVNKTINLKMIERSQRIESRMLESRKAQEKRDQEEQRKSNEYRGSHFERQIEEYLYIQSLKKNQEFLRTNPIEFTPYYKEKVNKYYLKKNAH